MMRRLSFAVAECYAALGVSLFKPSDVLGEFLLTVDGNPDYVDAEYEILEVHFSSPLIHIGPPTKRFNLNERKKK